jgi:glycine/D-amino acid oxidase-like deaminating enzyme
VVVIGAGMAGLCTGLVPRRRPAWTSSVLEARRIGLGVSGHTTAKVSALHDTRYASIASRMGQPAARAYALSQQEAVDAIERISREQGIDCASCGCQRMRSPGRTARCRR